MIANPHSPLGGSGTLEDPLHVRLVATGSEKPVPWWVITIGTVAVTYFTQRFLTKVAK